MEITILGCGEAFDERLPNTSILVRSRGGAMLLDCGYSIPPQVWKTVADPNEIDLIYISHPHADHYFGLPALLGRWWEDNRTKPLTILSRTDLLDPIRALMESGYLQLASRFRYDVNYHSAEPGKTVKLCDAAFDFAQTEHSVTNYAIRIQTEGKAFCYSGDGMYTKDSIGLFSGVDLLVHEAYWFESTHVHADIDGLIAVADREAVDRLALVHVQRIIRREPAPVLAAMARAANVDVTLPEPLARYEI
jgi:ribonuclease BN (tRNA processing enzyme)